jgi:hypothetical protein
MLLFNVVIKIFRYKFKLKWFDTFRKTLQYKI